MHLLPLVGLMGASQPSAGRQTGFRAAYDGRCRSRRNFHAAHPLTIASEDRRAGRHRKHAIDEFGIIKGDLAAQIVVSGKRASCGRLDCTARILIDFPKLAHLLRRQLTIARFAGAASRASIACQARCIDDPQNAKELEMGLGPPILALYRQLKGLGVFDDVKNVIELGAQNVWCPNAELVKTLFRAFGKPEPALEMLDRFASWKGSGLELYEGLGLTYRCIDVDPQFHSICMDLNFDTCPPEHKGKYDLVTNHGTSEHLINQLNFFKVMHELTKSNGYMLHAVPFTAHIEHGFFNYQPNFFEALSRYNSYRMCGI